MLKSQKRPHRLSNLQKNLDMLTKPRKQRKHVLLRNNYLQKKQKLLKRRKLPRKLQKRSVLRKRLDWPKKQPKKKD